MNRPPNYWLLGTTSTFIIPLFYAYRKKNHILCFSTVIAIAGSMNYWQNPGIEYNRTLDMITSRLSLVSYIFYGYRNVYKFYPSMLGYSNLFILYQLYNSSCKKFEINDLTWINYHMLFHIYITFSKLYVIYLL